jgi:hypothetical protein
MDGARNRRSSGGAAGAHDRRRRRQTAHDLGDRGRATAGVNPSPSRPGAGEMRMRDQVPAGDGLNWHIIFSPFFSSSLSCDDSGLKLLQAFRLSSLSCIRRVSGISTVSHREARMRDDSKISE